MLRWIEARKARHPMSTPFAEPESPRRRFWPWLARAPLTRIVIFVMFLFGLFYILTHLEYAFGMPTLEQSSPLQLLPMALLNLSPFVFAYWLLVRWIEQRKVDELATCKLLPDAARGLLFGTGLMLLVTAMMWLAGAYRIVGVQPGAPWLRGLLLVGVLPAVIEEIMFRGVFYRIVEDGMGSWIALALSSLLFGFIHAMNPNATLWSCIAIAIEGGLLLGLLYMVTRSLYACMGLHAAWNFMQGPVLGIPVSGTDQHGLLIAVLSGPRWLSGGAFGAEASMVSVVTLSAASCVLAMQAVRRGLIKPPFWRHMVRTARIEATDQRTSA